MIVSQLKDLHPDDVVLWLHVEAAVWRLAVQSGARVSSVMPTPKLESTGAWGLCTWTGGTRRFPKGPCALTVSLRRFGLPKPGKWGELTTMQNLLDTICHEVAHAKAGWVTDHGAEWMTQFARMILLSEKLNLRRDILKSGVKIPT